VGNSAHDLVVPREMKETGSVDGFEELGNGHALVDEGVSVVEAPGHEAALGLGAVEVAARVGELDDPVARRRAGRPVGEPARVGEEAEGRAAGRAAGGLWPLGGLCAAGRIGAARGGSRLDERHRGESSVHLLGSGRVGPFIGPHREHAEQPAPRLEEPGPRRVTAVGAGREARRSPGHLDHARRPRQQAHLRDVLSRPVRQATGGDVGRVEVHHRDEEQGTRGQLPR
jgi:hypothetical protein